jgi:hydrogenase maturation protein HypF
MKTIKLPFKVKKAILACGADMKGAFALAKGDKAYLFDGFGDLSELDNFTKYGKAIRAAQNKLKICPKIVVCDLHPGYFSTSFAESLQLKAYGLKLYRVQHHEAHIASAIIDNDIRGEVFGAAFDGTGYGTDGKIWGGEFFTGDAGRFNRVAHLKYVPMPGGEMCVKEPWRMAASYLYAAFGKNRDRHYFSTCCTTGKMVSVPYFLNNIDNKRWAILKGMIDKNINAPLTSSMGRLFDAAACLILNKPVADFEAELPMGLEKIVKAGVDDAYNSTDSVKIIRGIVRDIEKKIAAPVIAAKFHNSIAAMILSAAGKVRIKKVVLSGGVFQNRCLVSRAAELLNKNNFKVYTHSNIQTNDSGIPIGQIAITNARVLCV